MKKHRIISKAHRRERLSSFLFLLPSLLGLCTFYILPFFLIGWYALVDDPVSMRFVGLKNFTTLFHNAAFLQAMRNTVLFSSAVVPLGVVISLFLALALQQAIPGKSRFRTIFLSPMMIPVASIVLIWQVLFHQDGFINSIVPSFAGIDWLKSDWGQVVIVTLYLWKNTGYYMVLFLAALSNLPQHLLEMARMEGANACWIFFRVKLRYLSATILFVVILSFINSFKAFREVYLLVGDYPYSSLYLTQHFMNNLFRTLDYPHISAAALIMFLGICVLIAILFFVEGHFGKDVEM